MSGSGCMGVAGVVSAIVLGLVVGHILFRAGEKWRCWGGIVVTSWGRSESCTSWESILLLTFLIRGNIIISGVMFQKVLEIL